MLKNYTRLAYIDSGRSGQADYVDYARKTAEKFNLTFEEIPGSNALTLKLLNGPWDDEILVVGPRQTISYLDFRNARGGPHRRGAG